MPNAPTELSIEDLAERAGVPVRTVRYYIGQGLLAGPGTRGRAAVYGDEHLERLRLIRRLAEQHVPLAEQRRRLEGLSLVEVRELLALEERRERALKRAEGARSPRDYVAELLARARTGHAAPSAPAQRQPAAPSMRAPLVSSTAEAAGAGQPVAEAWQKWRLVPGVELQVRTDVAAKYSRLVERLLETAREAPGRDPGLDAAFPAGGSTD
jgi:DNA-binding transcriptional MerR regulator